MKNEESPLLFYNNGETIEKLNNYGETIELNNCGKKMEKMVAGLK